MERVWTLSIALSLRLRLETVFISSEYKDDFYINKENKDNRESVLLIYISLFLLSVTGERKGCVRGGGDRKGGLIPKWTFFWIFFLGGGGGGGMGYWLFLMG